jgi:hypothetical protein
MFRFTNFAILVVMFGVLFVVGCGNKSTTNTNKDKIPVNTTTTSTKSTTPVVPKPTPVTKPAPVVVKPVTQKAYTAYGNFNEAEIKSLFNSVLPEGDFIKKITQSLSFNVSANNIVTGNGSIVIDTLKGKSTSITLVLSGKVQDGKFGSYLKMVSKDYVTDTKKVKFEETIIGGWYAEKKGNKIDGYLYNTKTNKKLFNFSLTVK